MKMINQYEKEKMRDAFACSYAGITTEHQYAAVTQTFVEVFTALNYTQDDVKFATSRADGSCKEVDDCIDEIIAAFEE